MRTMRNRKTIITAFLLIACMLIGVGYAAVTNVLDIGGSAEVSQQIAEDEFNEDIYFTGVKAPDGALVNSFLVYNDQNAYDTVREEGKAYLYSANINSNNNDKAQFTIKNLKNTGDKQLITYQIKNDSEHEAAITLKSITNTNGSTQGDREDGDIFDFDFYFGTTGTTTTNIAAGATVEVTVVVTLNEQVTSAATASFILELSASAGTN